MTEPKNPAAENRRRQLRQWIAARFAGSQAEFIKSTHDGDQQINQGELSGLLKDKSFGEKRARRLEKQAGMPNGYLEQHEAAPYDVRMAAEAGAAIDAEPTLRGWPFQRVTLRRLLDLKRGLGGAKGVAAMHDIDETLELAVQKWENRLAREKSTAA